jgi:methionine synthase I (cobalamin-dependent)
MPATSVIRDLMAEGPVLTDGAWGTEMQARGLPAGEFGDLWNLSYPERVEEVARAYVEAGSQVILTNTFRANRIALGSRPERELVEEVNRAGVEISRRAAVGRARVFASIGPSGKILMTGEIDEGELRAAFEEQARALAEGGADAIVIETMADLVEARIAVEAAVATDLPVVACMVFDSGKNKDRTMMGVGPSAAASELARAGADAIGANCGLGAEDYIRICEALVAATDLPVWVKPNAGLPELVEGEVVYRMSPEVFAAAVGKLVAAGASFVGGCCGSNPKFIETLQLRLSA